jgi:hypothetical protein
MSGLLSLFSSTNSTTEKYYRVMITGEALPPTGIVAYTPEKFSISSSASFESRLSAGLGAESSTLQQASNFLQATTGVSLVTKKMSLATWTSSSPIEFQLPFLFNAQSDPYNEVHVPLARLLALTRPTALDTPSSNNTTNPVGQAINGAGALAQKAGSALGQNFIRGPGPTFDEPDRGVYTLTIGNIAVFTNMIITSVNVEMDSLITKDGYCISAQADVTVLTATMMLKEDLLTSFFVGGANAGSSPTTASSSTGSGGVTSNPTSTSSPAMPGGANGMAGGPV